MSIDNETIRYELGLIAGICERLAEELDEPKVEEGQYWQSNCSDYVYRVNRVSNGQIYHRDIAGNGVLGDRMWTKGEFVKNYHLLSDDEVEQTLIEEAERRGYEIGTEIIDADGDYKVTITKTNFDYYPDSDWLLASGLCLFREGDWAEIIEEEWEAKYSDHYNDHIIEKEDSVIIRSNSHLTIEQAEAIAEALNNLD